MNNYRLQIGGMSAMPPFYTEFAEISDMKAAARAEQIIDLLGPSAVFYNFNLFRESLWIVEFRRECKIARKTTDQFN